MIFSLSTMTSLLAFQATGKIRKTTTIDGIVREYYLHIPSQYDGTVKVPVVFMLHGTSGDGEKFYDAHGWKEVAERENFIAVFPSSGRYKIISDNEIQTTTKWNTQPDADWTFTEPAKALDDFKFLRKVIDEVKASYNINSKRLYLNGFSNGGQMAAKCAVEMSDVLAAVVENASAFFLDTTYIPKRKLPVLFQVGNMDYGPGNEGPEVPLQYLDSLLSTPNISYLNGKHFRIAQNHVRSFELLDNFVIQGDTNTAVVATYQPLHPGPGTGYEFKFVMVKSLAHQYPNGNNHPFDAPNIHWKWMQQYELEEAVAVTEIPYKNLLSIFPNPVSNQFHIDGYNGSYELYDDKINLVKKGTGNQVEVQGISNGIYFLKTEIGIAKVFVIR